jgi:pimeloyl-ACP methyl ester carboxylesterase
LTLESRARHAITRLVTSVLSVKPLAEGVAAPIRIVPVERDAADPHAIWSGRQWARLDRLLDRVARRAGVAGLLLSPDVMFDDLQVFERVVSNCLALAELVDAITYDPDELAAEIDEIAAKTISNSFDVICHKASVVSADGLPLNVYHAGSSGEAIVLVPACGMPAVLTESWMHFFARNFRVLTWESRGLFGAADYHAEYAVDAAAQAADLFTVMDHYDVSRAQVVGLCGGAVIALAAAATEPDRVGSLSLWHGAYEFADSSLRTRFQNDLIELMETGAHSRAAARSLQVAFCQGALTDTPADLAHLVLYPYATPELFYRYCRLNGTLARTDVEQYLARVRQPALVVTSQDDEIAHPQGSRMLADGLRNARLLVEPYGDHSSLFNAGKSRLQVAMDFITQSQPA